MGRILASIGIPLAIEAFKKLTGGSAPQMGDYNGGCVNKGGRAPRLGMYDPPPPFYGQWGMGSKKKKQKKGKGASKMPKFVNKPLSNVDLTKWIRYLRIQNFKGIYSRDETIPKNHSPCIINLDSLENAGTHWVCCAPSHDNKFIWYFDSFGMGYPDNLQLKSVSRYKKRPLRLLLSLFSSSIVAQERFL